MSSDHETEWVNLSLDFKFLRAELDLDEIDQVKLLSGLGKAVAYLLLSEEEWGTARIFVKGLKLTPTEFITDDMIGKALDQFLEDDGEEP